MTACASLNVRSETMLDQAANDRFLGMLDSIKSVARFAFRRYPRERRQELLAEVVGGAFIMFRRLVELRKMHLAYPTVLAWYAVRRIRTGRQVGMRQNAKDVLSTFAQHQKGFSVQPLVQSGQRGGWQEIVVEHRKSSPADVAGFRVDFSEWLCRLRPRARAIALDLAAGNPAMDTARRFGVSRPRISQVRKQLEASWNEFQGIPA